MSKTGIITAVVDTTRSFNHPQYGMTYYFSITFDNGDVGEAGTKSNPQTTWLIGQSAEYDITPNPNPAYAAKIQKVNPNFSGGGGQNSGGGYKGGGKRDSSNAPVALSYVKDLIVADKADIKNWFKMADKAVEWLEAKEKVVPAPPIAQAAVTPAPAQQAVTQEITAEAVTAEAKKQTDSEEDDLPF